MTHSTVFLNEIFDDPVDTESSNKDGAQTTYFVTFIQWFENLFTSGMSTVMIKICGQ